MPKRLTFEDQLARLEEIVKNLENGQLSLEQSLKLFEEGISLTRQCHGLLEEAEQRISILTSNQEGRLTLKDADEILVK